jgi:hypothetical protein
MDIAALQDGLARSLDTVMDQYDKIPKLLQYFGLCTLCAKEMLSTKNKWLFNYWVGFANSFGGGHTTAFLFAWLTNTAAATALFKNNETFLIYTVSWYLMTYTPAHKYLTGHLWTAALVFTHMLRINTITSRTEWAVNDLGGTIPAILVFGAIGGCGGTLWVQFMTSLSGDSHKPTEIGSPGTSIWSGILTALFHYALVFTTGILTPRQSKALIYLLTTLHVIAQENFGASHWVEPIVDLFHTVTRIERSARFKKKKAAPSAAASSKKKASATPSRGRSSSVSRSPSPAVSPTRGRSRTRDTKKSR